MSIPRVFLDSSVIVAGLGSKTGASSFIIRLCQSRKIIGYISDLVVREVIVNVKQKLGEDALSHFYSLLKDDAFEVVLLKKEEDITQYQEVTNRKDVHIIAGAKRSSAEYLVSLDIRHIVTKTVIDFMKPCRVVTPGDFLSILRNP